MRVKHIRQILKSLLKTFDEIYARILLIIDDSCRQEAITALQWLAFSKKSLNIKELIEAAIIDSQVEKSFDSKDRFHDSDDILTLLFDLITLILNSYFPFIIKLAHFSVKKFLVFERIQMRSVARYSVREIHAHAIIAEACLACLLHFDIFDSLLSIETFDSFSLLRYAAKYWSKHAQMIEVTWNKTLSLSDELFLCKSEAYINWRLFVVNLELSWRRDSTLLSRYLRKIKTRRLHSLYHAEFADLIMSVKFLLDRGANVNAQTKALETALQAACAMSH